MKIKVSLAQRNNTWQKGGPGGKKPFGAPRGGGGGFDRNDDRPPRSSDDRRGGFGGGGSGGSSSGGQARAGDWECSDCQNKNFSWRNSCNRCQASKPDDAGGSSSGSSGRSQSQRGGFQNRDSRDGGNRGFSRGGNFNRGGPMRDRESSGNRSRPY